MGKIKETEHVFLDTSIFIGKNYNYKSEIFQKLISLAQNKEIYIYLTDITVPEIESHIEEDIIKSLNVLKKIKNKAKILKNIPTEIFRGVFDTPEKTDLCANLHKQLHGFIKEASVIILPTSKVDNTAIFKAYFSKKPPFGEGKKKNEFPDAFVLEALKLWCEQNSKRLYVISNDGDMKAACDPSGPLHYLQKPEALLDIISSYNAAYTNLEKILEIKKDVISKHLSIEFVALGFYIDNQIGDVEEVVVDDINLNEFYIVDLYDNKAVIELTALISFHADASYADPSTGYYDEGEWILYDYKTETIDEEIIIPVEIVIAYEADDIESFKIISSVINNSTDISVHLEEDSSGDYGAYK